MEWKFFHSKLDQHIPMVFDPFAELNVTWLFIFTIWIKRFFVANSEIHICIVLTMNGERVFLFSYRVPCMQQKLIWLTFAIFFLPFSAFIFLQRIFHCAWNYANENKYLNWFSFFFFIVFVHETVGFHLLKRKGKKNCSQATR